MDQRSSSSTRFSRRRFVALGTAGGAAGIWAFKSSRASFMVQVQPSGQMWPVTCRDVMLRRSGAKDCWEAMELYGVDGVESDITDELTLPALFDEGQTYSLATPEERNRLRAALEKSGKKITALCMHNRFEQRPEFEIEWCTKVAEAAAELTIPAVRIDVVPAKMRREEFLPFVSDILKRVIAATESTGIKFAIENHGNTTNDPEFLDALFARVDSPRLGLTLDTGNFYWFGHPLSRLYDIYEHFASRVFHTHCKSINYPPEEREKQRPMGWEYAKYHSPINKGDIDFRRVLAILKAAGYQNDLCIENEGLGNLSAEQAIATVQKEVAYLREIQREMA